MDRTRWPGLAGLVVVLLALSASGAAAKTRIAATDAPLVSGNVTPKLTLPVGHPVGARFRDNYMFVTGTDGVSAYDISNPELPVPAGFLPLPHFENEDVDLGGNVLLVSHDPSEGVGILYVVDISAFTAGATGPQVIRLAGVMPNDTIADGGILAALADNGFDTGVKSPLPLGTGHTVSCVNPRCTYAYMAGTSRGIVIADLTDPAHPKQAGEFVPDIAGAATHDVQIDDTGLAWIVGYEGTEVFDVTDPLHPKSLMRSDEKIRNTGQAGLPEISIPDNPVIGSFTIGASGDSPLDLVHHDSLRLGTVAKPAKVVDVTAGQDQDLPGTVIAPGSSGEPSSGESGSSSPAHGSTPASRKKRPAVARRCRTARERRSARCKKAKKKPKKTKAKPKRSRARAAAARHLRGIRLEPYREQAGKTYPAGGDSPIVGIVEEDYTRPTCKGAGEFQLWAVTGEKTSKGTTKLGLLSSYKTELSKLVTDQSGWSPVTGLCSAHYFDYRDGVVAGGWYEEGTRFLDVRDPLHVRQVGYWVPTKGETWSVVYAPTDPTGQTVYALDYARGIDVLHLDRSSLAARSAPVRRSWLTGEHGPKDGRTALTGLSKRSRFGFVCRLPVVRP